MIVNKFLENRCDLNSFNKEFVQIQVIKNKKLYI